MEGNCLKPTTKNGFDDINPPHPETIQLIPPYGDHLVDLMVPAEMEPELRTNAASLPSLQISERSMYDLEMLATGGFSPLDRFMNKETLQRVLDEMRLGTSHIFPIPVVLPIPDRTDVKLDQDVALRDSKNELLAVMTVEEIFDWDKRAVAHQALGTEDSRHPMVAEMAQAGEVCISGRLQVLQLPHHYDFHDLRLTPEETRFRLSEFKHTNIVAFQTRNPLHRVHEELTKRAISEVDGTLLLHPVVGMTKPGDVDHYTRVRGYKVITDRYYDKGRVLLALLPLAMRMAGPREALWHAIIRRNYGANHLIIGRDHASPGVDSKGTPFYGPYDAQELVEKYSNEVGVKVVPFTELVYVEKEDRYDEASAVPAHHATAQISGTQVREQYLNKGLSLPSWFTRPEVAKLLSDTYPPLHKQGFCLWFTGLSGSGKSSTAEAVTVLLMERGRQVTVLDGDIVRTNLSKGLGFSREDRDTNIRRIGYVASEIVRHGGIAICAAVSPYRATRNEVRSMIGANRFIEVFINTPLSTCEARDSKGMYAKARRGEIKGFTGIDDPYENPLNAELELDTVNHNIEENAGNVIKHLMEKGLLHPSIESPCK